MEAILGTCVGVAIVDRVARVGGLYHILLPEQGWSDTAFGPELCASSGMPLFLEALRAAGCTPSNMKATVAGGALVGSISRVDLDLDLGGRTVDIVNGTLRQANIPVVFSETGGHVGSILRLNLQTLRCEVASSFCSTQDETPPPQALSPEDLNRAIAQIKPIPQVALKIIRTLQSDDYSLREVAREVRKDQVMTAKVLKICNSLYVGSKEDIKSIDQAIVMLGGRMVGQLILSSAMDQFFSGHRRGYSLAKGGLYHHAVSTAIVAEHIAKATKKAEPDIAYTAGLLHDIGKVLLDQYVASALPLFYRMMVSEGADLLETERSLLGVSHAEVGAILAERWSFPPALQDAIAHHIHPREARCDKVLTHLVYLADLLISRFHAGDELDRIGTDELSDALDCLGLATRDLPTLIGKIPWKVLDIPGYL